MPLDGSGAEEELGGDLRVRATLSSEAGDVFFLLSEIAIGSDGALADVLACRHQFPASSIGECFGSQSLRQGMGSSQLCGASTRRFWRRSHSP